MHCERLPDEQAGYRDDDTIPYGSGTDCVRKHQFDRSWEAVCNPGDNTFALCLDLISRRSMLPLRLRSILARAI
jgi:hypothetical protein